MLIMSDDTQRVIINKIIFLVLEVHILRSRLKSGVGVREERVILLW